MERDKTRIYSIMASCLGIDRTDIEAFVAMFEEQKDTEACAQKRGANRETKIFIPPWLSRVSET